MFCSGRTGVQLKDKWRNLVKFKHLTQAETACLATKTQKEAWKREDQYGYEADEQRMPRPPVLLLQVMRLPSWLTPTRCSCR